MVGLGTDSLGCRGSGADRLIGSSLSRSQSHKVTIDHSGDVVRVIAFNEQAQEREVNFVA